MPLPVLAAETRNYWGYPVEHGNRNFSRKKNRAMEMHAEQVPSGFFPSTYLPVIV
jgi:hypothetical protein